ncbi:heavy metal-binding domain-containing protein [Ornithinibacillus sp. BX22]|uniref:Heavy metal-binding domain-containing protein n=1 Tax=Ornithinibacillus hominis TaxID=2763055 RepID=A0A923RLA4_9BACI|nr:heavy metal-binding domain-containing protein [Ornithinibacillus hominis]MBC5638828.1 heavy metal-binding domain-containing protein [Ornithinibacillus hominis]
MQKKLLREQELDKIKNMPVSTLPSCDKPFQIIGLVSSSYDTDVAADISYTIEELKEEAHKQGADAVIGVTFQTTSIPVGHNRILDTNRRRINEEKQEKSIIKSRAVGTAIKYIEE